MSVGLKYCVSGGRGAGRQGGEGELERELWGEGELERELWGEGELERELSGGLRNIIPLFKIIYTDNVQQRVSSDEISEQPQTATADVGGTLGQRRISAAQKSIAPVYAGIRRRNIQRQMFKGHFLIGCQFLSLRRGLTELRKILPASASLWLFLLKALSLFDDFLLVQFQVELVHVWTFLG
uniref:Uncharacterized protein n=1 Tax=Plectus sambesii TaxID=2011161 RepID=A0A914XRK3_9BILA